MILGRNTLQWMGLITALASAIQAIVTAVNPEIGPTVAIVLGAVTGFLGVFIIFIANTSTTPISDPRLMAGTQVTVLPKEPAEGAAPQVVTLPEPGIPPVAKIVPPPEDDEPAVPEVGRPS